MAVLGRSRSGAPPDQILDPPLMPMQYLGVTNRPNINSFTGEHTEAVKKISEG